MSDPDLPVRHYWVDQGTAPTASQTKLARVELKLRKVGRLCRRVQGHTAVWVICADCAQLSSKGR